MVLQVAIVPVLAAALQDIEARDLKIVDYSSQHVVLALQYMDIGRFLADPKEILSATEAHEVYKLGHQWGYPSMEKDAAKLVIANPTWEMLHDLKHRSNPEYLSAVERYMTNEDSVHPEVVADLITKYRKLVSESSRMARKYLSLKEELAVVKVIADRHVVFKTKT